MNQTVTQLQVNAQASIRTNQTVEQVALFNPDGTVLSIVQVPANALLTGYVIAGSAAAVAATDSIRIAIGKLEKRIAVLEAA